MYVQLLGDFLREIKEAEVVEFGPMVNILVNQCRQKEKANRYTAILWVTEFISLGGTHLLLYYAGIRLYKLLNEYCVFIYIKL